MRFLLIPLFSLILFSCNSDDSTTTTPPIEIENRTATISYKQLAGVDQNELNLDIYYTSEISATKPVVIWVHGGGWAIGDKVNQIENKVDLFKGEDYIFVSINYRLSPFPSELNNPNRVKYPDHNNDVADAIKWVIDHISDYGGNPNKIALIGHSAGAHLVALTGTNSSFLESRGLSLNSLSAIAAIDTEGYNVRLNIENNEEIYLNAFGSDEAENIDASPVFNVEPNTNYPAFFIGKRGNTDRIAIADTFIAELENANTLVEQVDGSVYTHAEINEAIGQTDETIITPALLRFLEQAFR